MNSNEIAKQLNNWINNQEIVIEFKKYEQIINNNPIFNNLEKEIKELQKTIVNQRANQHKDVENTIQIYKEKKDYYDSHPVIVNYLFLKEEVDNLLQQINHQINSQL